MIKLDIDSDEGMYETIRKIKFYNYLFSYAKQPLSFDKVHRTHKGWHCYIQNDPDNLPVSIVLWQSLLGSDPYREMMNMNRLANGVPRWNIMFTSREDRTQNYAELFNLYLTMKVL